MKAYRLLVLCLLFSVVCAYLVTAQDGYSDLTVTEVNEKLSANPSIFLLDSRTILEYEEDGHIAGAYLIPHTEIEERQDELPVDKDTEIIVYCRSGSRSRTASEKLVELGYTNVYNMLGGINEWKSSDFDAEYGEVTDNADGLGDKLLVLAGTGIWVCVITLITLNAVRKNE